MGPNDFLPDLGIERIEELVAKMPQGFDLAASQVHQKSVTATFKFDHAKDVFERADDVPRLLHAAMCADTLCKNLRASRAALQACWDEWNELMPDALRDQVKDALGLREFTAEAS